MKKIYVGHTTMTHGLKGELKFFTDFSLKNEILKEGFPVYIDSIPHKITHVRKHQNHYLVEFDFLKNINEVELFRNKSVYILRSDLKEEIIIEELIGYTILENNEVLGKVTNILYNKAGILLEVTNPQKFFIPYHDHFIKSVSKDEEKILVENAKDLIL